MLENMLSGACCLNTVSVLTKFSTNFLISQSTKQCVYGVARKEMSFSLLGVEE